MVHPAAVQLRFPEYTRGQNYQLPFPLDAPQMMVYDTQDFAGYENDGVMKNDGILTYSSQLNRLNDLIEKGISLETCAQRDVSGPDTDLPFLPLVNSAQVFCAKPQLVAFEGGKGIRYITFYAQGMVPVLEWFVFYTFQGRTDDGQYYLSAYLPIRTNVIPTEAPAPHTEADLQTQAILLREQIAQINSQAGDGFTPSLGALDALISGVKIPGD